MKGVVLAGNRKVEILDFPDPTPGGGEVVLEIKASGLCGTDLKYYRRRRAWSRYSVWSHHCGPRA